MPTESLFTDLVIDTPEAAANYLKAIEIGKKMGLPDTSHALKIIDDPQEIRRIFKVQD